MIHMHYSNQFAFSIRPTRDAFAQLDRQNKIGCFPISVSSKLYLHHHRETNLGGKNPVFESKELAKNMLNVRLRITENMTKKMNLLSQITRESPSRVFRTWKGLV